MSTRTITKIKALGLVPLMLALLTASAFFTFEFAQTTYNANSADDVVRAAIVGIIGVALVIGGVLAAYKLAEYERMSHT